MIAAEKWSFTMAPFTNCLRNNASGHLPDFPSYYFSLSIHLRRGINLPSITTFYIFGNYIGGFNSVHAEICVAYFFLFIFPLIQ